MLHKTKGIVLNTIKYGDTSIIVHMYTRDFGRQSYMVNSVRGKKSKFQYNYFQPLTLLNLEADHKATRDIQRLRDVQIFHSFHTIQSNIVKNTIALFIGEVLCRCLHETEANYQLFDYAQSAIQILDFCEEACANFHLIFLVQFTRFLGIFPQNNLELDWYQPKNVPVKLHELINYSLKDLNKLKVNNRQRNALVTAMVDYYYYHLEGMSKISSLEVLHEVFS